MAETSVRSSSTNTGATGTAISVSSPTGTSAGDLEIVYACVNTNSGTDTIVDNNGATPFTVDLGSTNYGSTAGGMYAIFSRRILAGDPATYAFTYSGNSRWTLIAVTFQNPNPTTIYDIAPNVSLSSTSINAVTLVSPSTTTITNKAIHVAISCNDGTNDVYLTTPAGYTVEQNSGQQRAVFADALIPVTGATGTTTFSWTTLSPAFTSTFAIKNNLNPVSMQIQSGNMMGGVKAL